MFTCRTDGAVIYLGGLRRKTLAPLIRNVETHATTQYQPDSILHRPDVGVKAVPYFVRQDPEQFSSPDHTHTSHINSAPPAPFDTVPLELHTRVVSFLDPVSTLSLKQVNRRAYHYTNIVPRPERLRRCILFQFLCLLDRDNPKSSRSNCAICQKRLPYFRTFSNRIRWGLGDIRAFGWPYAISRHGMITDEGRLPQVNLLRGRLCHRHQMGCCTDSSRQILDPNPIRYQYPGLGFETLHYNWELAEAEMCPGPECDNNRVFHSCFCPRRCLSCGVSKLWVLEKTNMPDLNVTGTI